MKKILLVYIEPTPYILGLLKNISVTFTGQIDVIFLQENISQAWNMSLDKKWRVFPNNKFKRITFVLEIMRKTNYDLVHIAGWSEPIFLFILLLAKLSGIPVSIESDTPMPHHTKYWKRVVKRLFYPVLFKWVNLFLPGGKRQAQYLEYFGIQQERIVPAQMTVDVTAIQQQVQQLTEQDGLCVRQSLQIPEQNLLFLYVGRLEMHKGIMDLVTAFKAINQADISLLFVGDGTLRASIKTISAAEKNIHYGGRVSGDALIKLYYAADVVVLPSHFEPWGLVINEAMAVGKPVIVSDRVGCIDDLVSFETGMVAQAEQVNDLQQALEWMIQTTDKRLAMGQKAKQRIAHWTLENEAEIICNAWQKLLLA